MSTRHELETPDGSPIPGVDDDNDRGGTARRLLPWIVGAALIAVAVAAYFLVLERDSGDAAPVDAGDVRTSTAEAGFRDLVEQETLAGTLTYAGETRVVNQLTGTYTRLTPEGAVKSAGQALYWVDGAPAILMDGATPGYRTIALSVDEESVATQLAGTITAISGIDKLRDAGDILYRIDGQPVVLLDGAQPAYRSLSEGLTGRDVRQLEKNLVALGYDPDRDITVDREFGPATTTAVLAWQEDVGAEQDGIVDFGEIVFGDTPLRVRAHGQTAPEGPTIGVGSSVQPGTEVLRLSVPSSDQPTGADVRQLEANLVELGFDPDGEIVVDGRFSAATDEAIRRWQKSVGHEVDGTVQLGEVVFLPGDQRVAAQLVSVGSTAQPGQPALTLTSSEQTVRVDLEADRQSLVSVGDEVVVALADGTETPGTVASIGSVATTAVAADGTTGDSTVEVTIELVDASSVGLDQSPVDVLVTTESKTDALTVPVTALIALSGGGFAVEVADGAGTKLVSVEPGLFANGFVEVSETTLQAGDTVIVPQ